MLNKYCMLILCMFNVRTPSQCIINSRIHFPQPLPIMIRNGAYLEPDDGDGNVKLNQGEAITLSCESSGYIIHPSSKQQVETADVICEGGIYFKNNNWLNEPAELSLFRCYEPPKHRSRRTDRTCFRNNRVIEVGYTVQNEFYPLYESCFDENLLNAIYSKYTQKSYNDMYQTRVDRPYFVDDNNYYGMTSVNALFSPPGQKNAVQRIVGSIVDSYFTYDQHLSRGHLAAKTDFVFAFGERATFHYVNCAPQWTGFNGGNWNTLEVDLRRHIHSAGYNTIIYTGTYEVSQLRDVSGKKVDIYLGKDVNNNPVIPVPKYYYKVVYEVNTKRGIAFVGINNPYCSKEELDTLIFCEDVCRNSNFRWLTWHPNNSHEGYAFCCTVEDFVNTVPHLPRFEVNGLLL